MVSFEWLDNINVFEQGLEVICDAGSKIPHLYLSLKSEKERNQLYDKILQQPGNTRLVICYMSTYLVVILQELTVRTKGFWELRVKNYFKG